MEITSLTEQDEETKKYYLKEEQWLLEQLQKFGSSSPPSSECCIFRVPEKLQQSHKEAYTPRVIAIGPYHRGNQSLKPMESLKEMYLGCFLLHGRLHLRDYIEAIESWKAHIRSCYDDMDCARDTTPYIWLLDSSFMIQLFLIDWNHKWRPGGSDQIFDKPWMLNNVRRDMMLLENQIPFFVIQGLFEMAYQPHPESMPGLLELAYRFFSPVMMAKVPETVKESEVKHFLDAIRFSYLRMEPLETQIKFIPNVAGVIKSIPNVADLVGAGVIKFIPNVTDLVGAGVKLEKSES